MEATQLISDSILESEEEENEEENENKRERPFAKLRILKNEHIPETAFPLFLGDNVLGRDPNTCTLPLSAPSISKQHATICISAYGRRDCNSEVDIEALVWDLGSMNGTRKGRLKLTPNVRYALSDGDSLLVADIPCQYVRCAVDSTQVELSTPVNRNSDVKARLPGALGKKEDNKDTGSKKCVNGSTKARVSSSKTPVRTSCLSFEQTPTHPEGTLVPESDSDSDGEIGGAGDRRRKALMSDSDSHKSSPTCSTFLSPTNKIVPESEDESPITLSSFTKNRPHRHVSFSKETEVDVGGQLLEEKKAHVSVHDSKEEERAAPEGKVDEKSGQHVPVKQESSASPIGEDELPVCTAAMSTEAIPAFNMDSDTDMEGEEEGVASVGPLTLNTNPPNTIQFHMDSDTDVDEDEDTIDKALKTVPSSDDNTKPLHVNSVIQPEGVAVDSDTDVDEGEKTIDKAPEAVPSSDDNTKPHVNSVIQPEGVAVDSDTDVDDDAAVSDAVTKAEPMLFQTAQIADTASLMQPSDFHLDSDTDVDEEEDIGCKTNKSSPKIDEIPTRLDIKPESAPAAPHSLHLDSDTDDEAIPAPALREPVVVSAATESRTAANGGADSLCDSDTDVDDDAPVVIPVAVTTSLVSPGTTSEALESVSNADPDLDGSSMPPAGDRANPPDFGGDSDTDMEDKEAGEGQIPSLYREKTPGFLVPLLQNCSTPVQSSEEVEGMETQAFLSPSSVPFSAVAPVVGSVVLSSCSESQDEDYVVAETQSFILQTRDGQDNPPEDNTMAPTQAFGLEPSDDENDERSTRERSFQLGLSDSSHLEYQVQALAMESTQAFVSGDRSVNMDETQAYADRTSAENDLNLVATQLYGKNGEPARCSVMSEKERQIALAQEATQVYISERHSDSENETDEDERKNMTADAETQPLGFPTSRTLVMAETQPLCAFEGEETLGTDKPVSVVQQASPITQNKTEEREDHEEAAQLQQRPCVELLCTAETQPMSICDDKESNQEDSIPGPQKRKAKPLQLEEEQTQPFISSDLSIVDTQPMATSDNEESEDGDLIPIFRRRAKPMQNEEETQPLSSSEVSAAETQPMGACECEQSDEEDSIPLQRKRKAKRLQLEEEQTQPVTIETQPIVTGEDEESNDEDVFPALLSAVQTQTGVQLKRQRGRQSEAGTKGKNKALTTTRGRRGKSRPGEDDSDEEVEQARRARGKKSMRQQKHDEKEGEWCETEGNEHAENSSLIKEKQEGGLTSATSPCSSRHHKSGKIEKEKGEVERDNRREEHERLEMERKEKEARLQAENTERIRLEQERAEKERKECEEKERLEHERAEGEKKKRIEKERKEQEERVKLENEKRELEERFERERKEQEHQTRLQREASEREERERLEKKKRELEERLERKRKEQEEKERSDRLYKEKEQQLEKVRKEHEKAEQEERERLEREEKERIEKQRKEQEEKERLEKEKRELEERLERKEQEDQARLQREANEREERERLEKEKETKAKQIKEHQEIKEVNNPKVPTRGRKAARRTIAAPCTTEAEQDSTISTNDDVPARRTRSRSNSSNSVSSERSASSVTTQEAWGRGRGRGNRRTSEPPQATIARNSGRRRTVAAETTEQDSNDISPHGILSRCNSSNSLNSDISSCSMSSQNRGRGSRQRGRPRKTEHEPVLVPCINNQSDQNSAPKPAARGRKSRKTEESSHVAPQEDEGKADSQQPGTTRGQHRVNANVSKPTAADEEDQQSQEEGVFCKESPLPKRNARGRGQKTAKSETLEAPVAPVVSDGVETKDKRKGRKRDLEAKKEDDSSSSSKIWKENEKTQTTEATEEEGKDEAKEENPVQVKRGGRASIARAKKNAKESLPEVESKDESEKMEDIVEKKARGRPSAVQKKKKEEQAESGKGDEDKVEASEPQTPTTSVSRKRQAPANSSPVAKTPRSSSASPAARGRQQAASQGYKVLFTGLVDEAGERVLARLRGSMAKGVADMNCLVTDKVRRTVKFLCAVAKGIPIVTTQWLEKSGKAGSFLSPNAYVVKDSEQEKKFGFCLKESLRIASCQPLLQGYEIHVTKSVKPEPAQMKDIISCSGATFLPKMPSSPKPQTVVISCEEDWSLCGPAVSASLPVVTAEFILTGILQQKVDIQSHTLSAPVTTVQLAGGRGRGRKKT